MSQYIESRDYNAWTIKTTSRYEQIRQVYVRHDIQAYAKRLTVT